MKSQEDSAIVGPVAVFVGAPGAGKSSIGRQVAGRLGLSFRDTDLDISAKAGKPVSDIFTEDGEEVFRAMEREAVEEALRSHTGVLALGGGAVLDDRTRDLLADHRVIWLRVGAADAAKRVGLSGARPLLFGNVRGRLVSLLEARTPLYAEVATSTVDTDGRSIEDIVDEVSRMLAEERS
jgi:shikimate kinase